MISHHMNFKTNPITLFPSCPFHYISIYFFCHTFFLVSFIFKHFFITDYKELYSFWTQINHRNLPFCHFFSFNNFYFLIIISIQFFSYRSSTIFKVFLNNLPLVLDHNCNLGMTIISPVCSVLQYCARISTKTVQNCHFAPNCTLWSLDSNTRRLWLTCLLIILYKVSRQTV